MAYALIHLLPSPTISHRIYLYSGLFQICRIKLAGDFSSDLSLLRFIQRIWMMANDALAGPFGLEEMSYIWPFNCNFCSWIMHASIWNICHKSWSLKLLEEINQVMVKLISYLKILKNTLLQTIFFWGLWGIISVHISLNSIVIYIFSFIVPFMSKN
ncbi:hypothetical protein L1987_38186 [Smallanthus sonchifolius]|uniref:Uncharacterized protein n=1 Tax=Smallanthus sonchifolius TaxID=185202 RepID=A0ACB9HJ72_9ASTR|nr:hypothetical protein L1987_38186 [Smallanthus sonchifolius]